MIHKVGYIGFGGIARQYHFDTASRDDVPFEPVAVYEISEKARQLAESKGLKAFDNLEEFLDSHLFDFVVVAVPNNHHCAMTCAALEAGYNVMCEKPVAMNMEELDKMIETAKRVGKLFTVHQNRRVDKDMLIVKRAINHGKIGKPFRIESRMHADDIGRQEGWRGFANHGGGMYLDWGIHLLDQMIYMVGEKVKTVYANIHSIHSADVDDFANLLLTFESGLTAVVEVTTMAPVQLPRWAVWGDRGAVFVDHIFGNGARSRTVKNAVYEDVKFDTYPIGSTKAVKRIKRTFFRDDEFEDIDYDDPTQPREMIPQDWANLYKNIGKALDGEEELIVTPESVRHCFQVLLGAIESSKTGEVVHID